MKNGKRLLAFALALIFALALSACSSRESKYEGTYVGSEGATLILRSGGECTYLQTNWDKSKDGTWKMEDDILIVSVERLKYDIYARLEGDSTALLFEADNSSWRDELFVKAD